MGGHTLDALPLLTKRPLRMEVKPRKKFTPRMRFETHGVLIANPNQKNRLMNGISVSWLSGGGIDPTSTPSFQMLATKNPSSLGWFLLHIFRKHVSGAVLDLTQVAAKKKQFPCFWDVSL